MRTIRKILHPTDFSAGSNAAAELAIELARKFDADLAILHVYSFQLYIAPLGGNYALPPDYIHRMQVDVEQALVTMRDHAILAGVRAETLSVEGNASEEIVTAAERLHVDHIVMGTHGRTGLRHLLLGSVAERVLRKAPCPVTTVRTTD